MCNHHVGRGHHHAGIAHANGHLTAQGLVTWAEHITKRLGAMKPGDLGHLLLQGTHRQIGAVWHSGAERQHALGARFAEYLADDAATGHQCRPFDRGNVRRLCGQRRTLVHIKARLRPRPDQALILQIGIGLQHGGMADTHLRTQLAHRRHPLAGLIHAAADIVGQLLGNALIEQQIGHGCGSAELNRYSNKAGSH